MHWGPRTGFARTARWPLWLAGELRALEAISTELAERSAASGSVLGAYQAWLFRAIARAGMGRLADAESDAELALQAGVERGMSLAHDGAQGVLMRICIERGDLDEARARMAPSDAESQLPAIRVDLAMSTAMLARAEGAVAAERAALRDLQQQAKVLRFGTWVFGPWPAALAVSLGPCDEARQLAAQALSEASMRAVPGEIGLALRAEAMVLADAPDIERLRAAAAVLEQSELALEHARTLVDLGAALRRRGHRVESRQPLRAGLERAFACGATALVDTARTELLATGSRPRRLMVSGRDALTPSERRVAILAAEGRSNRDIAQTLFVTSKTVETHLSRAYRKLDITSRSQLADALSMS